MIELLNLETGQAGIINPQTSGKYFIACNGIPPTCELKVTVSPHYEYFTDVRLKFTASATQIASCGCVLHDCWFMTRCGSPDQDCQSAGYAGYLPACNPCYDCGIIYDPPTQSCVGCGNYIDNWSPYYSVENNRDIYEWSNENGGTVILGTPTSDKKVGISVNFAEDVNAECPPSSTSCDMIYYVASSTSNGGYQVETFKEETVNTVTTTVPTTTTISCTNCDGNNIPPIALLLLGGLAFILIKGKK